MTSQLLLIRATYLLLLVSICSISDGEAQDIGIEKLPTLPLIVRLNGKDLVGVQELAAYTKEGKIVDEGLLRKASEAAVVPVSRKYRQKLNIYVDEENGKLRDVTREPGVFVFSTLDQLQFGDGTLSATPPPAIGTIKIPGPITLFIYYYQDKNMEKGKFGFNEFFLRLDE